MMIHKNQTRRNPSKPVHLMTVLLSDNLCIVYCASCHYYNFHHTIRIAILCIAHDVHFFGLSQMCGNAITWPFLTIKSVFVENLPNLRFFDQSNC